MPANWFVDEKKSLLKGSSLTPRPRSDDHLRCTCTTNVDEEPMCFPRTPGSWNIACDSPLSSSSAVIRADNWYCSTIPTVTSYKLGEDACALQCTTHDGPFESDNVYCTTCCWSTCTVASTLVVRLNPNKLCSFELRQVLFTRARVGGRSGHAPLLGISCM
jgi:hypothetical protein